jgi:predicted amidohydrolase
MSKQNERYDIVISGGRAMDPETGLDAVRNAGITADKIATITEQPIEGKETIDATGHVVVNGTVVVKDSKVLKGVYPGKAIRLPVIQ